MAEKQYKYKARIKQPQTVVNVKLDPTGGVLTEREYKTVTKDPYGASLLEKGLLVVEEIVPDPAEGKVPVSSGENVPDFDTNSSKGGKGK